MTATVLISGASGFIASHTIAALLAAGYQVIGTARRPDDPKATAHLRALPGAGERLYQAQARGRYLCAGETRSMRAVVEFLRAQGYGHTRLPRLGLDSAFGNKLAWLASCTQPKGVATYLRSHLGRVVRYDNAKIRRDLGLAFRPLDDSIRETVADLARWGQVPAAAR